MAANKITAAELAVINNRNLSGAVASEIAEQAPVAMSLYAQQASQSNVHQWLLYNDPPPADWRALNDGRAQGHSVDINMTITCGIMDASFSTDVAAGTGHIAGTQALIARDGRRAVKQAFFNIGKGVFYGAAAPSMVGLIGATDGTTSYYDDLAREMVIDGGGTTADVQSSVWLLRTDWDNVSLVMGNNGKIIWGESRVQRITSTANSLPLSAWHTPVHGWFGLQWGSKYSACRIANVEATLTDDMIASAIAKFPNGFAPNLICMSRRSQELLRASRTATNPSGQPAPFVENCFGLEVITTDEIIDTEGLVIAA